MSDPISLLLEAIEAREQKARKAARRVQSDWRSGDGLVHAYWGPVVAIGGNSSGFMPEEASEFIADNDPSFVLRHCKADREIVKACAFWLNEDDRGTDPCAQAVLEQMAIAYGITEEEK